MKARKFLLNVGLIVPLVLSSAGISYTETADSTQSPSVGEAPSIEIGRPIRVVKPKVPKELRQKDVIVGADGYPRDIKVARSLGLGLDEKAIEAVQKWRFLPARKGGVAVAVAINVELQFRVP